MVLTIYVDDIIITGPDHAIDLTISALTDHFKLTGGDDTHWCLGIKINNTLDTIVTGHCPRARDSASCRSDAESVTDRSSRLC